MDNDNSTYLVYSPASILGIFNNALKLPVTVSIIYLKGKFVMGGGKSYGNYYYDHLYSESGSSSIGIKISSLLRSTIVNNDVYTFRGFIEKKIKNSSIELIFVIDEVVQKEEKTISEEELIRYELIQKKLEIGSRDLENFIRDKKLKNEPIKIANIYGHNAIVQKDFSQGLDVSQKEFEILDFSCNITSSTSILERIRDLESKDFDIIALVRGGGDKQSFESFNDVKLAEEFINLKALTITAIGHTVDETLIDKLSDKRFHLPHDYGLGLHTIIDKLFQEKSNSRAILIDEVKKDVTKQFTEQVNTLSAQLKKKNEEFVEAQKTFKEQIENHTKTFNDQLKVRNDEVEKLKKDLSEKHGQQVKTLTDQLTKRNEEFQKFQESSAKQLQDLQKNFADQQKQRTDEMERYKKEIASLHEKNINSAVKEKTATISASLENLQRENAKLNSELSNKGPNYSLMIIMVILALVVGFIIAKII